MNKKELESSIDALVYKKEKSLFFIHALLGIIFWIALIVGTFGAALFYVLILFIAYLFAQSGLISWIKGNGVKITEQQFPDLYRRHKECCEKLNMSSVPDIYLIQSDGVLNAFAARFMGRDFIVLYSNIVDAMADNPDAINFYLGHELAHLKRKHLQWGPVVWPASILPLIGAAYSRAREYTCDQYGRFCCADPKSALQGLAVLAAGEKRYSQIETEIYLEQAKTTGNFWMAFHELIADYPWLVKRTARVSNPAYKAPRRNFFAGLLALFIPRLGFGGGIGGVMVVVAMIGILAAVALPAYQDYSVRAQMQQAYIIGQNASELLADYYHANDGMPETLEETGFHSVLPPSIETIVMDSENGVISVTMAKGAVAGQALLFVPQETDNGSIIWQCMSEEIASKLLPLVCR